VVTRNILIICCTLALSACGGSLYRQESNCPGYIENGHCRDLRETYESTHDYDRDRYRRLLREQQKEISRQRGRRSSARQDENNQTQARVIGFTPLMQGEDHPRPILTQAIPVRVFVDPFEDENGRLHTPGFIYVRATEPEWIFGSKEATDSRVVTPLVPQ
jgi:conjugal transfer pilus assembly protein TraV